MRPAGRAAPSRDLPPLRPPRRHPGVTDEPLRDVGARVGGAFGDWRREETGRGWGKGDCWWGQREGERLGRCRVPLADRCCRATRRWGACDATAAGCGPWRRPRAAAAAAATPQRYPPGAGGRSRAQRGWALPAPSAGARAPFGPRRGVGGCPHPWGCGHCHCDGLARERAGCRGREVVGRAPHHRGTACSDSGAAPPPVAVPGWSQPTAVEPPPQGGGQVHGWWWGPAPRRG